MLLVDVSGCLEVRGLRGRRFRVDLNGWGRLTAYDQEGRERPVQKSHGEGCEGKWRRKEKQGE